MVASIEDAEALVRASRDLLNEIKQMDRLRRKAAEAPPGKPAQKAITDLNWKAMSVMKTEAAVHAAAVNCGVADLREPEHYATQDLSPTAFHRYRWDPPRPRRAV